MSKSIVLLAIFGLVSCAVNTGPTKRKMVGLIAKFDRWDYNGNGQLEKSELKDAEQIGGFGADEIIEFYDTDGNHTISLGEAQSGLTRLDEAKTITEEKGL